MRLGNIAGGARAGQRKTKPALYAGRPDLTSFVLDQCKDMAGRRGGMTGGPSGVMRGSMAGSGVWYLKGLMIIGGIVGGAEGGPLGPPPNQEDALRWRGSLSIPGSNDWLPSLTCQAIFPSISEIGYSV